MNATQKCSSEALALESARWNALSGAWLDEPCEALPDQVRRSSKGRPWKGLMVWHQQGPTGDLYVPPTRSHCIVLRRSSTTELVQRHGVLTENARIRPGDAIIVPAQLPSFWRSSSLRDYVHIDLDPSWLRQAAGHDVVLGSCFGRADPVLAGFGHLLLASLDSNTSLQPSFGDSIALGIALHLLENYASAEGVRPAGALSRREMDLLIDIVASGLNEDWNVARLAAVLGLSPFYFSRTFKRSFGQAPHAYVTSQRMEHAARLVRGTRTSFAAVAAEIGYASPSHFTYSFRRYWGVTPMAYRKGL